jgi:hypothetical protein
MSDLNLRLMRISMRAAGRIVNSSWTKGLLLGCVLLGGFTAFVAFFLDPIGWESFVPIVYFPIVYLLYFAMILLILHLIFLSRRFSKSTPKYLEYAYLTLLAIGLLEIVASNSKMISYMKVMIKNDEALLEDIRLAAREEAGWECEQTNSQNTNWGRETFARQQLYCNKLSWIAHAENLKEYVTELSRDAKFMNRQFFGTRTSRAIRTFVNAPQYRMMAPTEDSRAVVFSWLTIILLPIGIGLRVTKTSMELYGDLYDPSAAKEPAS